MMTPMYPMRPQQLTPAAMLVNADQSIVARAEELFRDRYSRNLKRTDRLFGGLMVGQWVFGILLAALVSPQVWQGRIASVHLHVLLAVFLGGAISSFPLFLAITRPGETVTRYTIAVAQMLWSALLIHLSGGRIETHFHVFGSLAFLAFYRDWKVIVPATLVVVLDHLLRQIFFPESVYGIATPEAWRFLEHGFWVVFEDVFLITSCIAGVREMKSIAQQQARIEHADQMAHEMEIAAKIQTALLPARPEVRGLTIAATMVPASEVGGDYYDVLPVADGCWIGIGDVAGHGLVAGLTMLQSQSAIKALVLQNPNRSPRDVLCDVNGVLVENGRRQLGQTEHMTMSLLRYYSDGRVLVAGAHQSIVIVRAATGRAERHPAQGTWLGLVDDIRPFTEERTFQLHEGDLLVLFTDGITEAMNAAGQQFGLDRLCADVESLRTQISVEKIRDQVLSSVTAFAGGKQEDDATLLVLRQERRPAPARIATPQPALAET
jgi:serine phosphatase RsbU (regulator of sigma subunit)